MIKTTTRWGKFISIWLIFSAVFFVSKVSVFASQYQQCLSTTNCTIGEFIYDDNYQKISTATCSLTAHSPSGDVLLNAVNMSADSNSWYSYSVGTSGLSNGTYPSQMCCSVDGDNMCLDKTFEIGSGANASLVADIWSYPSRSLSSFTNLITGIWSHSNKTLTSANLDNGSSLATTTSIQNLSTQISQVQTSIETVDTKVTSLQTQVNNLQSDINSITTKWGSYSVSDIIGYIDTLETQLGNNTQTCSDNTVFGHTQCLVDKWGSESASTIYNAANGAYSTVTALRSELAFNGKSTTAYDDIQAIKAYVDTIETSIGSTSDTSSSSSIFGRIKQVKEAVDNIDNSTLDLNDLLAKWNDLEADDIYDKVVEISTQVSSLNTVTNVENITNNNITQTTDLTDIKNQILAMRAILDVNKIQLEQLNNKPIVKNWLEEGSVIFKTLITNPSKITSQKVSYSLNLPSEVKENHIIKKSSGIEIKYDSNQGFYYGSGEFELKPKETIILEIEVEDIWQISDEKINSLKKQAEELYQPLKKTSFFAQGSTLYSSILASLDEIVEIQKRAVTPDDKIKNFKDASIKLDSVNRQLDDLKSLVTQSGSFGNLSGFIGGVQTFAVWGIVIVLVAGFVFLAIYMKSLSNSKRPIRISTSQCPPQPNPTTPTTASTSKPQKKRRLYHYLLIFSFIFSSAGSTAVAFYILKDRFQNNSSPQVLSATDQITPTPKNSEPVESTTPTEEELEPIVEPESTLVPTETPAVSPKPTVSAETTTISQIIPINSTQKKVIVMPSINSYANIRSLPDRNSTLVTKVVSGQELIALGEKYNDLGEKWINVSISNNTGWILGEIVQYVQSSSSPTTPTNPSKVDIIVPDRDTIYLYSRPSFNSSINYKLTQSQSADVLVETKRWVKVILSRINVEGWISQDFITKKTP